MEYFGLYIYLGCFDRPRFECTQDEISGYGERGPLFVDTSKRREGEKGNVNRLLSGRRTEGRQTIYPPIAGGEGASGLPEQKAREVSVDVVRGRSGLQ